MDGSIVSVARPRGSRRRAPRGGDAAVAQACADLGPEVRLDEAREGAGRTVKGWRPDPGNPLALTFGARSSPPHHRLMLDRRITPWAYEAGQRFAGYWQAREIARTPDPDAPRAHRAAWERASSLPEARLLAGQRLREAEEAVGRQAVDAVRLVCVAELPLYEAYGRLFPHLAGPSGPSRQIRAAVVQGMLVVALEALAHRWRLDPRRRKRDEIRVAEVS